MRSVSGFRTGLSDVYFCFGRKLLNINSLCGIDVYFCIRGRISSSWKIKDLGGKNVYFCILLYTFHIWRPQVLFQINGLSATEA